MIGSRLKDLRMENNITQKELADYLGVTPKAVSFYELDQRVPPPEIIKKIANKFNVSIDYLFGYSMPGDTVLTAQLSSAEIGSRIQERLTQKGISPAEMDDLTGFKKGTTAKWIAGKITNPPIGTLEVLSAATGLSISLLRGDPTEDPLAKYQNLLDALNDDLPDLALTNQEVQQIITYIKFLISQRT